MVTGGVFGEFEVGDKCWVVVDGFDECWEAVVVDEVEAYQGNLFAVEITDPQAQSKSIVRDPKRPKEPGVYYEIFPQNRATNQMAAQINRLVETIASNDTQRGECLRNIDSLAQKVVSSARKIEEIAKKEGGDN